MRTMIAAGAVALSVASLAHAEPSQRGMPSTLDLPLEGVATNPDWLSKPNGDQISAVFPKFAQMLRLGGRAEIHCTAEPTGSVDDCHVRAETPVGLGFGAAAISLAPFFHMRPATLDGKPVKGEIEVPILFALASEGNTRPGPLAPLEAVEPTSLVLAHEILALQKVGEKAKRSWQQWLDGLVTVAVESGETRPSVDVINAFQASIDDVEAQILERAAHALAAQMSADQLRAIKEFYQSSAGQALLSAEASEKLRVDEDALTENLAWVARDRVCAKIACEGPPEK